MKVIPPKSRVTFGTVAYIAACLSVFAPPAFAQKDATPVGIEGSGYVVGKLQVGEVAFRNRKYVWKEIPAEFVGWQFTETDGGEPAVMHIHPSKDGALYVATAGSAPPPLPAPTAAWKPVPAMALSYDPKHTPLAVYRTHVAAGATVTVPQSGWTGTVVLAPQIADAAAFTDIVPAAVASATRPPGTVIDYIQRETGMFVGSPTIVILPDGSYVAAHDIFGKGPLVNRTRVFRSEDRGKTWHQTVEMTGQFFSTLFLHRGALYLLGDSRSGGLITIRRSTDGGRTWTTPRDTQSGILSPMAGNHTAPTPVVEFNGRLWRAMEWDAPKIHEHFQASLISAPVDSDLLRADSWTRTNIVPAATDGHSDAHFWLEGNAVVTPRGTMVDILRIWHDGVEKAALLNASPDGRTLTWDRARDTIAMPGGGVKFTIRFDPVSKRYWTLVNKQRNPNALRNVLALISSPDLRNWTVEATLLQHPDTKNHAFQYIDWVFDGDDIVAVSRTSWDGNTFHNANYLTFHRITNFRSADRAIGL